MSAPPNAFPIDQVISPAIVEIIAEVMRERARAIVEFGHDAAADDAQPLHVLGEKAAAFLQIASERAAGSTERRTLPAARKKAIQGIAIGVAFLAAVDREIAREEA
ncbi:MAG: hypothetical protein CVT74_04995 [Alphaproteobacteria bacterium HGW-Alphaproteobacteria-13]|nr:MAG: hypothetical protein CVT74_04995 [Alphaproteobacteria bacterium HGW-Alphaproteobacteria-13]